MRFLMILFLIFMTFWLVVNVFGRKILQWGVRFVVKKAEADLKRKSEEYEKYHGTSNFEEAVYRSEEVKVTRKKGDYSKPKPKLEELEVEDVEFEEMK